MSKCPVDHQKTEIPAKCPVDHSGLNPNNKMPYLENKPVEGQKIKLPLEREVSSIPKTGESARWEYPSPQQFFTALKRKGKDAPEEEIETMVAVHNFINEASSVDFNLFTK